MVKEKSLIRVMDISTGQTLFEGPLTDSEKAYQFAAQMEDMGLDVKVVSPTLSETLTRSLGLSNEETAEYLKSMDEEAEHHDGSCCFEDKDHKIH